MTKEIFEKVKDAKSAEEIVAIAKEDGKELTAEQAKKIFDDLCGDKLSDDDLEKVAGGRGPDPWEKALEIESKRAQQKEQGLWKS